MNFIRQNLANAFTLGNLFSGCIGAVHLFGGDYRTAALCIAISLILDFFDGFVARAMKANSELGVQLDSLADMVTFGFLPGLTMYKMLEPFGSDFFGMNAGFEIKYLGFFITLFSCLRLAIFNLDDEQKFHFKGLNTPSNTLLIFGIFLANQESGSFRFLTENPALLLLLTFLSSWLLISPVKMLSLKFKSMKIRDNVSKIVLATGAILLLALFGITGIPLVIVFYIFTSLLYQNQI